MSSEEVVMRQGARLGIVALIALVGCDREARSAKGREPAGQAASSAAEAAAKPAAPPAPPPPCIVGRWDGRDLVDKIRGATRSIKKAGLTHTSGTILFEFANGEVTATPSDFVLALALGESGLQVNGTVTLSGSATMPYTLGPDDALSLGASKGEPIQVHAVVKTSGIVNVT